MPEGPSILILKEHLTPVLTGKKIQNAFGNAKIDFTSLVGKKITDVRCWGKQLLIFTDGPVIRIHLLMFGSYSVDQNTRPARSLRLAIEVSKHRVYFYTCSVKLITKDIALSYDWGSDVLSDEWNALKARKKLRAIPKTMVCDALLDQQIFSGVGNIIKNEVLYRIKLHPETLVRNIPAPKFSSLLKEARNYSFDFLKWKKECTLKKHWLVHTKKKCSRCDLPMIKKYCGKTQRRTFFCIGCQIKYPR